MLIAMRRIAARFRRLMPIRAARRFIRQEDGATAVEFGMVALPFLALTFALFLLGAGYAVLCDRL